MDCAFRHFENSSGRAQASSARNLFGEPRAQLGAFLIFSHLFGISEADKGTGKQCEGLASDLSYISEEYTWKAD